MAAAILGICDVVRDFYSETFVHTELRAPIEDLTGKVIIVTGASAGLGKESVRQLAVMRPAKIIMTARNLEKGEQVRKELLKYTGFKNIQLERLDLCSMDSVNAFSKKMLSQEKKIDVLMCNAGVGETKEIAKKTADGFDEMFQGNNLGHYLLTQNLLPLIKKAGSPQNPARIIYLSSLASKMTFSFDINSYNNPKGLSGRDFYLVSKLMACLMANGMAERVRRDGITCNSVHPGTVKTEFADKYSGFMLTYVFPIIYKLFARPLDQGAATQVFVASSPEGGKVTGRYWSNLQPWKANPISENPQLCRQFCELCDELIAPFKP